MNDQDDNNNNNKIIFKPMKNIYKSFIFMGLKIDYPDKLQGILSVQEYQTIIKGFNQIVNRTFLYLSMITCFILMLIITTLFILPEKYYHKHNSFIALSFSIVLIIVALYIIYRNLTTTKKCKKYQEKLNSIYSHRSLEFFLQQDKNGDINLIIEYTFNTPHQQPHQQFEHHSEELPFVNNTLNQQQQHITLYMHPNTQNNGYIPLSE